MSVIIRLQNLPWSANAMDIRNFFRGLSIPEGGVHIVGGELGDAFIAFSTDEDARQGMMMDGGKLKEIQVKLLLSSRSEMHKVIEAARQSVPVLALQPPATAPQPAPAPILATLPSNGFSGLNIPGIGNPLEIPQPAVIQPPAPALDTDRQQPIVTPARDDDRSRRSSKENERRRSRSRSRDKKDRPRKERRERSRSRDRSERRRRDRRRDRKDRSRSRDRSHDRSPRRSRSDRRSPERRTSPHNQNGPTEQPSPAAPIFPIDNRSRFLTPSQPILVQPTPSQDGGLYSAVDQGMMDTFNRLQEIGKKRDPNAFQGDMMTNGTGGPSRGLSRREGRISRFDNDSRDEQDCCLAVRGAPTHTSYGDVRRFFPFPIDKHGIKMINDASGRRSGTIYVRFCDARSRHLALQQHPPELKGAAVLVEPLDDLSYNNAIDSFMPYRADNHVEQTTSSVAAPTPASAPLLASPGFTVLRLSDLPAFVKEHDIVRMFSQYSLLSITLGDGDAPRTRAALLHFVKPEDAQDALQHRERYVFGRRQATVTALDERDLPRSADVTSEQIEPPPPEPLRDPRQRRSQPQSSGSGGDPGAQFPGPQFGFSGGWGGPRALLPPLIQPPTSKHDKVISLDDEDDEPLTCTLMKGLPPAATDRSIVEFLSDTGAVPARIHLMLNAQGLPSGDCFCEFRSEQEARRAATKHGSDMAGCRVSLDLVSPTVVEEALEGPRRVPVSGPTLLSMSSSAPTFDNMIDDGRPLYNGMSRRGVFRPPYRGRGGFERPRGGFESRGGFDRGRGMRRGGGYDRGGFDRSGDRGRGFDRGGRGYEGRGRGRGLSRGRGMYDGDGRGPYDGDGRGTYDGDGRGPEPDADADPALQDFGAPGCVLCLENVPFRATVDELLAFFGDFKLTQDDVIRRFNERGQPTGDARVAFRTSFDAQRALTTRNMATIHDRRISLRML